VILDDTHPQARRVWIDLLRRATPAERFASAADLTDTVIDFSLAAVAETMPGAARREVLLRWCELNYGPSLTERLRRRVVSSE